jgi:hypothetical protein
MGLGVSMSDQKPVAWDEPMAWIRQRDNTLALSDGGVFGDDWTPLYTAPPQRKPLSESEIVAVLVSSAGMTVKANDVDLRFARAIERAHGIGS